MICRICGNSFQADRSTFIGHQHCYEDRFYAPLHNCQRCGNTQSPGEQTLDHARVLLDAAEVFKRESGLACSTAEALRLHDIALMITARAESVRPLVDPPRAPEVRAPESFSAPAAA